MNMAPWAKLSTPSVPRMIERPLAIRASRLPSAMPLKACDRNWETVGMDRAYIIRLGQPGFC